MAPLTATLLALLSNHLFFPGFYLFAFSPLLAIILIRNSLLSSLWMAALIGLFFDLTSAQLPFGLYALLFVLTAALSYRQKRFFFDEKAISLASFTAVISLFHSLLLTFLLRSLGSCPPFSWKTVFLNFLCAPILSALFSFFWFSWPLHLYNYVRKKIAQHYYFQKKS